ncbi:TetR/AcrR family transcriptional regulator [Flexivirga meconopsidis]|uniref:TetR/AcrR family transcriptional regulator n=1 Tax=Flexivirga meconopsidis TaxID=2977121 RepID=UPI0022409733|nr:TetR family transcriptional regulator [Flexivirga meconopsidis]
MVSAKKQPQPDDAGVEHNVSSPDDRNRIHEAAAKLFESQGYSQTTLTEIARLAGVCLDVVEEHGPKIRLLGAAFWARFAGDEQELDLATYPLADFDATDVAAIARVIKPVIDGMAASLGVLRAIEDAATCDSEAASLLEDLQFAHRSDTLKMLAQHPGLSARRRRSVADVLIYTFSHHCYEHLVIGCGWSRERYRRWVAEHIVTTIDSVLPAGR